MSETINRYPAFRSRRATAPAPAFSLAVLDGQAGHRDLRTAALMQRLEQAASALVSVCHGAVALVDRSASADVQIAATVALRRRLDSARLDLRDALVVLDQHLMRRQREEPADADRDE